MGKGIQAMVFGGIGHNKCFVSRDVTFNESQVANMMNWIATNKQVQENYDNVQLEVELGGLNMIDEQNLQEQAATGDDQQDHEHGDQEESSTDEDSYILVRDRKRRVTRPPQRYAQADEFLLHS